MTPQSSMRHNLALRTAVISALVAVTYYLTAIIGFGFALQPGSVSTLWMPNAILLAGLLLTPQRWWWLVILAVLPAHLASELSSGVPTAMVLSWFVSNVAQALLAAILVCSWVKDCLRFDRFRDLTIFILLGAFLAPFLASFLDAALVKLNGWGNNSYWDIWRVRFFSNVIATLTLVPVVMLWVDGGIAALKKASPLRYLEGGFLLLGLLGVGIFVFDVQQDLADKTSSLLYLPLPFLLWATVRFGPRGTSTSLLLLMFLVILGATRGAGPFVSSSAADNALSIQWFLIVVSIPLMALAAVIEERRRAEALARRDEERLTLALNAAQMGTWDWQINDNALVWTEDTRRIFGLTDPASLDAFYRLVHPDDMPMVEQALSRAIADRVPFTIEFRLLQDGNIRWVLSKGSVLYDESEKPSRVLGIALDLTDRKRAEHELAEINEQNQAILRAIPDMMFLLDNKGVFLDFYTREAERLLLPPESFLGKTVYEVLPQELAEKTMENIHRLNGSDEPQMFEYDLLISGGLRHYEARLVAAGADKSLTIVRDVTEARRAIEVARRSQEQLVQGALQIRSLAARLLTAQESERRRISLLLHDDVSQNVAAMGLAISSLKRKLPTSNEEIIAQLDRLGEQAHDLTAQIRKLSHQLHPEVLEQLGLVAALESYIMEFGHKEKIKMKFLPEVGSDPLPLDLSVCLYRVALEALQNISRHAGTNSARVSVKEENGFVLLEVSDSGRGFDVEHARRGSGIGLLSIEERVKLLHGTLSIRSEPNKGTVLVARVPFVRSA